MTHIQKNYTFELMRRLDAAEGVLYLACDHRARKERDDVNFAETRRHFWQGALFFGIVGILSSLHASSEHWGDVAQLSIGALTLFVICLFYSAWYYDAQQQDLLKREAIEIQSQWRALGLSPRLLLEVIENFTPPPPSTWRGIADDTAFLLEGDELKKQRMRIEEALQRHLHFLYLELAARAAIAPKT